MTGNPLKSGLDRLLEMAIVLVAIGLLLQWAWQLIRPLIPVVVIIAALVAVITLLVQRKRNW